MRVSGIGPGDKGENSDRRAGQRNSARAHLKCSLCPHRECYPPGSVVKRFSDEIPGFLPHSIPPPSQAERVRRFTNRAPPHGLVDRAALGERIGS